MAEDMFEARQTANNGEVSTIYKTVGTCSQFIEVGAKDGVVTHCNFIGGCVGNTKGISQLVVGMSIVDVIARLNGVRCGMKTTSCPDQLCRALEQLQR